MLQKATFNFLKSLKKNNNRDWFEINKHKYLEAKLNVESVIENIIKSFSTFEKKFATLTPKDCLFRIYRDVRFSKIKVPYKTNMGAGINIGGKKAENAGYYIHFEPGNSFIAGGLWMPPADQLKKIRQEIDYNSKAFHKIIKNKTFCKYFKELDATNKLMRPPKGYGNEHSDVEYLKLNSYIVVHKYSDAQVNSSNFVRTMTHAAKAMKPFLDFLNTAID